MKRSYIALVLVVLLVVLFVGGGLLYKKLSAPPAAASDTAEAAERHQMERGETVEILWTPEPEETPDPTPETTAEPDTETAEEPASVSLSEDLTADFSVQDEEGNYVSLSERFGKPIVVNFFATWCPPCRAELPYFDAACEKYAGQIEFMVVDLTDGYSDTVESATAFVREENGYRFPLYFDVDYSGVDAYQINAIPVTLFIRADGSLLHMQIGGMDEDTLEGYLMQLLA